MLKIQAQPHFQSTDIMMKKAVSLLLCIILIFSTFAFAIGAEAADIHTVQIKGKYHQSQARTMLTKVNAFRTNAVPAGTTEENYQGTQAWAWNKTGTKKLTYNREKLSYDYELEQIAMQRAAEISVYYGADHTRPDGTSWRKAHTKYNDANGYSIGENIFATLNSDSISGVQEAFEWWLEANDPYEGQSHRRNMLGTDYPFVSVAFACFEQNEVYYWVALFRSAVISSRVTTVGTDDVTIAVNLNTKFIKSITLTPNPASYVMDIGQKESVLCEGKLITTNHILSYESSDGKLVQEPTEIKVVPTLTSSQSGVVGISGNTVTAQNTGQTVLTASAYGKSVKISVRVLQTDITGAAITLTQHTDTYIYTGEPIYPEIESVTFGEYSLSPNDYTVSYLDNTAIGTGTVTITGRGNFSGVSTKSFSIIDAADCKHNIVIDPAVAATCRRPAKTMGSHCSICGKVFIEQKEEGDPLPHKEQMQTGLEPTCTDSGYTAWSKCADCGEMIQAPVEIEPLGHDYPAVNTVTKATLTANGSIVCACTRCGEKKVDITIYRPLTYILAKAAYTYNGKVQKPKLAIKNANGAYIGYTHYKASIPNGKNVGRYKITILFNSAAYAKQYKYLYYDILPKNTSAFTLGAGKKSVKVKWNTQKVQTTGYQIQYSLYADFRKATTFTLKNNKYNAATISKLTGGKKYYVRMRTYKTVNYAGKNINLFSVWSGKKSITAKK